MEYITDDRVANLTGSKPCFSVAALTGTPGLGSLLLSLAQHYAGASVSGRGISTTISIVVEDERYQMNVIGMSAKCESPAYISIGCAVIAHGRLYQFEVTFPSGEAAGTISLVSDSPPDETTFEHLPIGRRVGSLDREAA